MRDLGEGSVRERLNWSGRLNGGPGELTRRVLREKWCPTNTLTEDSNDTGHYDTLLLLVYEINGGRISLVLFIYLGSTFVGLLLPRDSPTGHVD